MSSESVGGRFSGDLLSDADSGMVSDESDKSNPGDPLTEVCQVGNKSFIFPQNLYNLPNLFSILSLKTWNRFLTDEERFYLAEYLPDMDQKNLTLSLKELFSGSNFHFGNPLAVFFDRLKGGLFNPSVVLYGKVLNIFQKQPHYYDLCEYQNAVVESLVCLRDVWQAWHCHGIEERLQLLNILRSQKIFDYDSTECSDSTEVFLNDFTQSSRMDMKSLRPGNAKGILKVSAVKRVAVAARKWKWTTDLYIQANDSCDHARCITDEAEESLYFNARLTNIERQTNRTENKSQISTDFALEDESIAILACNSRLKKRKGRGEGEYHAELDEPIHRQCSPKKQIEGSSTMKKNRERNADTVIVASSVMTPEPIIVEKRESDLEMHMKTENKPFTLITPTIHTGFSFSIVHLLSAVRKALTTVHMEDAKDIYNPLRKDSISRLAKAGEQKRCFHVANGTFLSRSVDNLNDITLGHGCSQSNLPSLRIQQIVDRVKSNPGDPFILETSEPLQDLVRGVLKIFSLKTAPLGAKGWKVLILYDKSIKSWSWVGPVSSNVSDNDNTEEETSAEAWGIPRKMLVKLVDAFANWLKRGQEVLQQIGSLPAPPAMFHGVDYTDRFRDIRAQKSLKTISSSSEDVRAYFRREELCRYSIPDRAFQYTAHDGRKSIVAPLRRGGGKPTSKVRDHHMLKADRPPHVTVLCLVRDAAARLPGGIGTRADVCTLIRDSQYIVEDVTNAQVNQVISGALDRLHYELDPCVQFDGERKLWVYLHGDREEEDFEDDGTLSTKKWKRQRNDPTNPSKIDTTNDSNHLATCELTADVSSPCEFNTDINIVSSDVNMDETGELCYNDLGLKIVNVYSYVNPACCEIGPSNSVN